MDDLRGRVAVKAERDAVAKGDSDSDSDSFVERMRMNTLRRKRAEKNRIEAQRARAELASQRPPAGAAAHAASARRAAQPVHVKNDQQRQLYRANLEPLSGMGTIAPIPDRVERMEDFLERGELTVDLMARIDAMYKPEFFDKAMTLRNPKLYEVDTDEQTRGATYGTFHSPEAYTVVREMLARHPSMKRSDADVRNEVVNLCNIEPVPRRYAASMLREADNTENPCVNGENCLTKRWYDFVMVEFLPPSVKAKIASTGERSSARSACLLCQRRMTTYTQALQYIASLSNPENYVRQCHRNIVNREGEYPSWFCSPIDHNTPYHIVMNSRFRYERVTVDGRKWLRELYPQCTKDDEHRPVFSTGTPQPRAAASAAPQAPPKRKL